MTDLSEIYRDEVEGARSKLRVGSVCRRSDIELAGYVPAGVYLFEFGELKKELGRYALKYELGEETLSVANSGRGLVVIAHRDKSSGKPAEVISLRHLNLVK